jgi:phage baseplate assembly protein W
MTGPAAVFGRGISFPPRVGVGGRVAWSEGEPNIREAVQVIVKTAPGERLRLPGFGVGLDSVLFEPNNAATRHQVAERIRRAVADWEPRVTVEAVQVDPDPADPEVAVATVEYQLVATGEPVRLSVSIGLAG